MNIWRGWLPSHSSPTFLWPISAMDPIQPTSQELWGLGGWSSSLGPASGAQGQEEKVEDGVIR